MTRSLLSCQARNPSLHSHSPKSQDHDDSVDSTNHKPRYRWHRYWQAKRWWTDRVMKIFLALLFVLRLGACPQKDNWIICIYFPCEHNYFDGFNQPFWSICWDSNEKYMCRVPMITRIYSHPQINATTVMRQLNCHLKPCILMSIYWVKI